MDLSRWARRFAAGGPIPVFAVAGAGRRDEVQDLRLRPELRLVDTPRAASLLLVAGVLPEQAGMPLARIHDALPHPRATLIWRSAADRPPPGLSGGVIVEEDLVGAAVATYRELWAGSRPSEPPVLPDIDPAPWRGVGPYGQGGTAMTGGVPYGRPMAELAPDPDGLRLDVLPVAVGPFFPRFPVGLVVDVRWAGDLVIDATVGDALPRRESDPVRAALQPFLLALTEPVPIARLELARARDHLRWLADALHGQGLSALGVRALRLATTVGPGDSRTINRFARMVGRTQAGRWATRGVGRLTRAEVEGHGLGPVGRAAGVPEDVRREDPAYAAMGFEPVLAGGGDAAARWQVRLAEVAQSLELAARAGERRSSVSGRVESPRGLLQAGSAPADRVLPLIPDLIRETSWGDAVTAIGSLDVDLEESGLVAAVTGAAAA